MQRKICNSFPTSRSTHLKAEYPTGILAVVSKGALRGRGGLSNKGALRSNISFSAFQKLNFFRSPRFHLMVHRAMNAFNEFLNFEIYEGAVE